MILRGDESLETLIGYIVSSATTEELEAFIDKATESMREPSNYQHLLMGLRLFTEAHRIVKSRKESGVLK